MKCHCGASTVPHVGGPKDGTFHCNGCGCCLDKNGMNREGHMGCSAAIIAEATVRATPPAEEADPEPEAETELAEEADPPKRGRR